MKFCIDLYLSAMHRIGRMHWRLNNWRTVLFRLWRQASASTPRCRLDSSKHKMKLTQHRLIFSFLFSTIARATNWDTGSDADLRGDLPAPTLDPFVSNAYPYFSLGSIPVQRGLSHSKDAGPRHSGRLEYRQLTCSDPTYILSCPVTDPFPCCPPNFPLCCPVPSTKCCATGTFCVGLSTCCPNGTTGCGEGCCESGTTCCNGQTCCNTATGYSCQGGQCVNPTLSSQSVVSVASASSASIASLETELSGQTVGDGSNINTVNTVTVTPNDPRIEYDPPTAWTDVTSNSGVGSCNNGTKATNQPNSTFEFTFSGSAISLSIVPSANGGPFSVQVDGEPASNLTSKSVAAVNQCIPSQVFSQGSLEDGPHLIVVTNGATAQGATNGGTLEFNGITYTGKGAFGTPLDTSGNSNKASPAVIGGSVGGVLGAVVLVGAGVLYWLYRKKKRNGANGASAPVTPNQPMMYQQQQPGVGTPYSPTTQVGSLQHPPSAYGGMVTSQYPTSPQPSTWSGGQQQQYPTSPGQQQYPLPQQYTGSSQPSWQQQQQQAYSDYHRPASGASAAGIAPLPMWVERASRGGDGMSTTTGEHTAQPGSGQY